MSDTATNMLILDMINKQNAENTQKQTTWDAFMDSYEKMPQVFADEESYLRQNFADNLGNIQGITDTYTGNLNNYASRLDAPESKVTFGLQGFDPISVTTNQARQDVGTLSDLAAKIFGANMSPASMKLQYEQAHTPYTAAQRDYANKAAMAGQSVDYTTDANAAGLAAAQPSRNWTDRWAEVLNIVNGATTLGANIIGTAMGGGNAWNSGNQNTGGGASGSAGGSSSINLGDSTGYNNPLLDPTADGSIWGY